MFFPSTPADRSQNRVVGIVTVLWTRDFSCLQNLLTSSRTHPASYLMGVSIFSQGRQLDHKVYHSLLGTSGAMILPPYLPLWCGQGQHFLYILPLLSSSVGPELYSFINMLHVWHFSLSYPSVLPVFIVLESFIIALLICSMFDISAHPTLVFCLSSVF